MTVYNLKCLISNEDYVNLKVRQKLKKNIVLIFLIVFLIFNGLSQKAGNCS